jgi:hypothetical protein
MDCCLSCLPFSNDSALRDWIEGTRLLTLVLVSVPVVPVQLRQEDRALHDTDIAERRREYFGLDYHRRWHWSTESAGLERFAYDCQWNCLCRA